MCQVTVSFARPRKPGIRRKVIVWPVLHLGKLITKINFFVCGEDKKEVYSTSVSNKIIFKFNQKLRQKRQLLESSWCLISTGGKMQKCWIITMHMQCFEKTWIPAYPSFRQAALKYCLTLGKSLFTLFKLIKLADDLPGPWSIRWVRMKLLAWQDNLLAPDDKPWYRWKLWDRT